MKILFASASNPNPETWIKPLQAALPEHEIINWEDDQPSLGVEIAIVWNPPAALFTREPQLKAVFNRGASVDAILQRPGWRDDIASYRLGGAGMAIQMGGDVTWALVRASGHRDRC